MTTEHIDPPVELAALTEIRAPASLHRSTQLIVDRAVARRRRAPRPALALAGAFALLAAVMVVLLGGAGAGAPSVARAAAFATRPATAASPAENPRDHDHLLSSVDGIAYPYWGEGRRGWRTAGARTDSLGGYRITTVFYSNSRAQRIGYSIVAGNALPTPAGRVWSWSGVRFHQLNVSGTPVVSWLRAGHTCILAGKGVSAHTLLRLAAREA
jgi:hypothetical protein